MNSARIQHECGGTGAVVDTRGLGGHTGGESPGCHRMAPRVGGSVEPLTEGIHKDTDGPDQASDSSQDIAHLPGRHFALADFDMSAFRLGHGPHLLSVSLPPRQDTRCSGRRRRGGPTSMPDRPATAPCPPRRNRAARARSRSGDGARPTRLSRAIPTRLAERPHRLPLCRHP